MIDDDFYERNKFVLESSMRIFLKKILIRFVTLVQNEGGDENSVGIVTISENVKFFKKMSSVST